MTLAIDLSGRANGCGGPRESPATRPYSLRLWLNVEPDRLGYVPSL